MTISDIAVRCGVSVSTVSRVLNGHPNVSDDVRARVQQELAQVHYVPNKSALDLVRQQSDAVGLVVRGIGNPFFSESIAKIERAISAAGYALIADYIHSNGNELLAGAELAKSKRLRGLIFLGGRFDYNKNDLAALEIPFVCCSYTNSFGTLNSQDYSSVTIDDAATAFRATELLLKSGHRRVALLADSVSDRSVCQLRYMGYCKALASYSIPVDPLLIIETKTFDMQGVYQGVQELIKRGTDFSALFAIADSMALAAIKALHDAGRSVPRDCSVVGIDGLALTEFTIPTLTTFVQPKTVMGETAEEILVKLIRGEGKTAMWCLTRCCA